MKAPTLQKVYNKREHICTTRSILLYRPTIDYVPDGELLIAETVLNWNTKSETYYGNRSNQG